MVGRQTEKRRDGLVPVGPGLLGAAIQPVRPREQQDGLHEAAEVRPLRRSYAAVDRDEQADRRPEHLEVAGILRKPGRSSRGMPRAAYSSAPTSKRRAW